MPRVAQFGIALGTLGAMLTVMGLFPGVTGVAPTGGIGIVQVFIILNGFALLISGALIYLKFTFYYRKSANLVQQIGVRLSLTAIMLATMIGFADLLGFGSHPRANGSDTFLGLLQAAGMIGSFLTASLGVIIYAVSGNPGLPE